MDKPPPFQVQAFGEYYLLDRIAVGGMAEIFKAKQSGARGFEKIVVIKKILPHLTTADEDGQEFISMFEDEAKIAAQLNQGNIVQIFELGETDGVLYIVMEYVEGRNLRDLTRSLSSRGLHLSIEQSCFIISDVLRGLDYAHRKKDSNGNDLQIVHRDMSPQNIIISYEGEVKILDFGIVKAATKGSKTEAGVLKGKFSYMSPEQASGRPIDQSTDVYACGVMLYELLTSERLFKAETDMQTLERVKLGIVPRPSEKNKQVPKRLDEIVLKALNRSQEKRYGSAGEMLSELNRFCVESNLNYNTQQLSAFMKTLFADSIQEERSRLRKALDQIPSTEARDRPQAAKTHIAFKSPQLGGQGAASAPYRSELGKTQPTFKGRGVRRALWQVILVVFLVGSFLFFLWSQSAQIAPILDRPHSNRELPPIPKPSTETETNTEPPRNSQKDLSNYLSVPTDEPNELVIPVESNPAPESNPKPKPPRPTRKPKPDEDRPKPILGFGRLTVLPPVDGYAEFYIDGEHFGSVPGPRARDIKLTEGSHRLRCEAGSRIYEGRIDLKANEVKRLACHDLPAQ